MNTARLPLPIATQSPLWLRAWDRVKDAFNPVAACRHASTSEVVCDWYPLRDLPDSLQRDIGLPESLRERAKLERERDSLWLHV